MEPRCFDFTTGLESTGLTNQSQKAVGGIVKDVVAEDGVRKVQVDIVHKHEEHKSATMWTIALVVVLLMAGLIVYAADGVTKLVEGDDNVIGDCADGSDNDGDQLIDSQDPGCRPIGQYDDESYENRG